MDKTQLIHRLNRIEGQIKAIRRDIENEKKTDCKKNVQMVKATTNAMKKFGQAYVEFHLDDCLAKGVSARSMEKDLKGVIASAFSL